MLTHGLKTKGPTICKPLPSLDCNQGSAPFKNVNQINYRVVYRSNPDTRVFDGVKSIGVTNVLIEDGKIAAVGGVDPKPDSKVIDGRGKTLLPGMIDCHTHVWFETHLQQAAMFGVTTELDMMSSPGSMKMFRSRQKRGKANNRADVFSAGAAVTVKGGHGTQFGLSLIHI